MWLHNNCLSLTFADRSSEQDANNDPEGSHLIAFTSLCKKKSYLNDILTMLTRLLLSLIFVFKIYPQALLIPYLKAVVSIPAT